MKKHNLLYTLFLSILICVCMLLCFANINSFAKETEPNITYVANNLLPQNVYQSKLPNNVKIDKQCYTGETFALSAVIIPANAYVGRVQWTVIQDYPVIDIISTSDLACTVKALKAGTGEGTDIDP